MACGYLVGSGLKTSQRCNSVPLAIQQINCSNLLCFVINFIHYIYIYIFTRKYLITHALTDVFFAFVGTLDSNYTATDFH